jgi:type VI protein secretion system component Hcp
LKDLLDIMRKKTDSDGHAPVEFDRIRIGLASPEMIKSWSHGEVKKLKPLTIVRSNQNVMVYSVPKFWSSQRLRMLVW